MFTGLVAELGTVTELKPLKQSYNITVKAQKVLENLKIGDSIAVNGACLTDIEYKELGCDLLITGRTERD